MTSSASECISSKSLNDQRFNFACEVLKDLPNLQRLEFICSQVNQTLGQKLTNISLVNLQKALESKKLQYLKLDFNGKSLYF